MKFGVEFGFEKPTFEIKSDIWSSLSVACAVFLGEFFSAFVEKSLEL
tara:strand:+ start:2608 stop:2748 length:141 start_codon:yes stop_codon:yes gene_type:complete